MGHSCRTLLRDTPVGHTLRTRLPPKVTLRGCKTSVSYETSSKSHASSLKNERFLRDFLQKSHVKSPKRAFRTRLPPKVTCQVPKTSIGHSCGILLWDTLVGHTLVGHCCGTLLWDTLKGHSCETLLRDTVTGHSCGTLLWDTHLGHSCGTLLWDILVRHS